MRKKLAIMIIVSAMLAGGATLASVTSNTEVPQCPNCKHKVCCNKTVAYPVQSLSFRSH